MGSHKAAKSRSKSSDALPLMDMDAVAASLNVSRRHVQRLVSERRIPFLKVGRFVRFDPAELSVWLDQQRVEAVRGAPHAYAPWR